VRERETEREGEGFHGGQIEELLGKDFYVLSLFSFNLNFFFTNCLVLSSNNKSYQMKRENLGNCII